MTYDRFEQLPVWQAAMDLGERVYAMTARPAFRTVRELVDQLRRAALSVSNNVAEGFERGTTAELLSFLYIARGSAGETRSVLRFCRRLAARGDEILDFKSQVSSLKSEISDLQSPISDLDAELAALIALAESCSRQIRAWADHLQNSDIAGPRRLNDQTRRAYAARRGADALWQRLQDVRDAAAGPRDGDAPDGRDGDAPDAATEETA